MYAVIGSAMKRANNSHTIGNALIYECVRTISTIYPNPGLLSAAAEAIATFLRSPNHNLRYIGINALAGIVQINPAIAQEHQLAVVDCLEDPDDTLKLKTLELLYKMTKANNVEVIVDRMMGYLRTAETDEHIKRDIVGKVTGRRTPPLLLYCCTASPAAPCVLIDCAWTLCERVKISVTLDHHGIHCWLKIVHSYLMSLICLAAAARWLSWLSATRPALPGS